METIAVFDFEDTLTKKDSGDMELLKMADKPFFRCFR